MIGKMVANAVAYDQERGRDIERIWAMLTGTLDGEAIAKIIAEQETGPKRPGKAEINRVFGV
jgi:hypothetical protein